MKRVLAIVFGLMLICTTAQALTTTTNGVGNDWNAAANWDNGVPGVDDTAIVNHNMDIGAAGATFTALDNNATITFSAQATVTIKDGGSIDNTGGIINASDQNVSFVASAGVTMWTWTIDSGTWTDGTGEHHFENGHISTSNNYTAFNSGSYFFDDDMWIDCTASGKYFRISVPFTVAASTTLKLSDGTNAFYVDLYRSVYTISGGSGTEITINGNGDKGYIRVSGGADELVATLQYINFIDCDYACVFYDIDTDAGDALTFENCMGTSSGTYGFLFSTCTGAITLTSINSYSNTGPGIYIYGGAETSTFTLNGCELYSNSTYGFQNAENTTLIFNRCKVYSNTSTGISSTVGYTITCNSCLFYGNAVNVYIQDSDGSALTNCTLVDAAAANANVQVDLDTGGYTCTITNCIIYGAKYCVNSTGTSEDPTVSHTLAYNANTANYTGMTDPTGTWFNTSIDPMFKDYSVGDYRLRNVSKSLDTGETTAVTEDINNESWLNSHPDRGCYTNGRIYEKPVIINVCG